MSVGDFASLQYAWGEPSCSAIFKQLPEDFVVEEQLGFEPSGEGEHLYLFIEKRDLNTNHVVSLLAQQAGIQRKNVGYSGLKDRRAVTRQWFSLYLPGKDVDDQAVFEKITELKLLRSGRHQKKLRMGTHVANRFTVLLRAMEGEQDDFARRVQKVGLEGVPNYFGAQRFGRDGSNLVNIDDFLARSRGKQRRHGDRMQVSAMRSWLFNKVLSERVRQGNWQEVLEGEPEASPSGPLWGRGRSRSSDQALALEQEVLSAFPAWCDFLEHCGLDQARRALILHPRQLVSEAGENDADVQLSFALSPGAYATSVLRELCHLREGAV